MATPVDSAISKPHKTILVVVHDIGGAQAVLPVVDKLRKDRSLEIRVIAGRFAQKIYARHRPTDTLLDWSIKETDAVWKQFRPDLLLTSTSWKSTLEQRFRNQAQISCIPSVVVLDYWSNYRMRWQHADYAFEESCDQVCVMDSRTAKVMKNQGYPWKNLHVTGQPHLEHCARHQAVKSNSGAAQNRTKVLLLSINLSGLGLPDEPLKPVRIICGALSRWQKHTGNKVILTIRQHPHENSDSNFLKMAQGTSPRGVGIRLADNSKPLRGQVSRHDIILGYTTMALFEARCMGKQAAGIKVVNYAPELTWAMKEAGIALIPFDADRLVTYLKQGPKNIPISSQRQHRGATLAVVKLCRKLLK